MFSPEKNSLSLTIPSHASPTLQMILEILQKEEEKKHLKTLWPWKWSLKHFKKKKKTVENTLTLEMILNILKKNF